MPLHFYKKTLAVVITALCFAFSAPAQYDEKNFTRYTVKSGLSDNIVNCLQQDDQGYLWIGTDDGLSRFDGNSFKNFYRGTAPLQLPSMSIGRLKRFGTDSLGILSSRGFLMLNTKKYSVQHYRVADSTAIGIHTNAVWDVVKLPDKSFGVTSAAGFYRFNSNGKLLYRHDAFNINDIGQKRILYGRDIFRLQESKYIAYVNEEGIALYDDEKKIFTELKPGDEERKNELGNSPFNKHDHWTVKHQLSNNEFIFIRTGNNEITYYNHHLKKEVVSPVPSRISDYISWESKIVMLDDSMLAINGSVNGFYILKINRQTGNIAADGIKHLRSYKIRCLYLDKEKRLWAGTSEGLLKQELKTPVITAWHYQPAGGEKYAGGFSAVYRYKDKLYAGRYSQSKGLAIIDPNTMKLIKEINFFSDKTNWNEVRSIEMYHTDTLWFGTSGGLLWFDTRSQRYGKVLDGKKYPSATILDASLSPSRADGYAWMCAVLGGKVLRYHIPQQNVYTFYAANHTCASI